MIKPISFIKDGVEYVRCSTCPDRYEKFISKVPHVVQGEVLIKSSFNGIRWAADNGYILKRFTIIQ